MSNDFFDSSDYTPLTAGTLARAAQVNDIASAVVAGFDKLPAEAALKQDRATYATAVGGPADAITLTLPSTLASYTAGLRISFKVGTTNTGATTVNVDSVGAKSIKRPNGDALVAGDLISGAMVDIRYDGTNFQLVGYSGADISAAAASATAAASSATAAASSASAASTSASSAASSASAGSSSATAAAASAVAAAAAVNGVKASSDDTTPGDLETKLLPGDGIAMSTQNGGGNETRTIAYTGHGENIRAALCLI